MARSGRRSATARTGDRLPAMQRSSAAPWGRAPGGAGLPSSVGAGVVSVGSGERGRALHDGGVEAPRALDRIGREEHLALGEQPGDPDLAAVPQCGGPGGRLRWGIPRAPLRAWNLVQLLLQVGPPEARAPDRAEVGGLADEAVAAQGVVEVLPVPVVHDHVLDEKGEGEASLLAVGTEGVQVVVEEVGELAPLRALASGRFRAPDAGEIGAGGPAVASTRAGSKPPAAAA